MGSKFHIAPLGEERDFMSIPEAAKVLRVKERTIYLYKQKGTLRSVRWNRHVGVHRDDVAALLTLREQPMQVPFTAATVNKQAVDLRQVMHRLDVIERILDLRRIPLEMSDAALAQLPEECENALRLGWGVHLEHDLADRFQRMRFTDLERMAKVTGLAHPWVSLYRLALALELRAKDLRVKEQLGAARHNIEHLAFLWVAGHGGTEKTLEIMIQKEVGPVRRLLRQLAKTLEEQAQEEEQEDPN